MTNGTDTGWMGTSLCRGLGGNRRTHPFHPLPPRPQPPFSVPPGRTQGAHRPHASRAEDEVAGEAQV